MLQFLRLSVNVNDTRNSVRARLRLRSRLRGELTERRNETVGSIFKINAS